MAEKILSVRIDEELIQALKLIVVAEKTTMQNAVAEMVSDYVAKRQTGAKEGKR
jgi:hypothetical protein